MKMILDCPDDRITPKILSDWAKKAKQHIGLKMLVGSFDKKEDAHIILVIGLIAGSKITEYQASLLNQKEQTE